MNVSNTTIVVIFISAILLSGAISAVATQLILSSQNFQSEEGDKGDTGAQGPQGEAGPKGEQGLTGLQGPEGERAAQGLQGETGEQGPYLPDYDRGWVDINSMQGEYFTFVHNLNFDDLLVEISGKTQETSGFHQRYLGLANGFAGWNQTYGGEDQDRGASLVQTSDGGFVIAGRTDSFGDETYVYLVRTNGVGNLLWNKTYVEAGPGAGLFVVHTDDGGFAISGITRDNDLGQRKIFLIKTDSSGNILWNKTFSGYQNNGGSLVQTADGGFALVGSTTYSTERSYDVYLIKTNAGGDMLWNRTYSGTDLDEGHALILTNDGGFGIAGRTYSFGAGQEDVYLIKTNSAGNMLWNNTYGGEDYEEGESLVQTNDGGFAIVGTSKPEDSIWCDIYLVKTNSAGSMLWNNTYGGESEEWGESLIQTLDGGLAIVGLTDSYGAGESDMYLIKTGIEGELGLAQVNSTLNSITLYRGLNDIYWNYVRVRIWKIE